jgi:dienelactone hydrolase
MAGATAGAAGMSAPAAGMPMGAGACCKDGDCLCHGDPPAAPTNMAGPFKTANYDITSAGCVYYPMDAEPPFAAVTISDGFGGTGGCGPSQTNQWGPLYASWGIVAMIIHTGSGDQPNQRGTKLTAAVEAFKKENEKSDSPLKGKLSGRYGTSGFSMGGGGTTFAAAKDPMLKTSVAIMAWGPTSGAITVPSLYIFGSSDTLANTMGMAPYRSMSGTTPKMAVTVSSGHAGQPSAGGGESGKAGLAFQKVFLEGDERWRPLLLMIDADDKANIE